MPKSSVSRVFGKRSQHHTIILASGDNIRHWTVRPWLLGMSASFLAVMSIGYLLATTYLVVRDDLIGASMARQARIQHAYEDRIASLRSQVDRITSRQLLDQQQIDNKMTQLLAHQARISSRHGKLDQLFKQVAIADLKLSDIPVPTARPITQASSPASLPATNAAALENAETVQHRARLENTQMPQTSLSYASPNALTRDNAGKMFDEVLTSLEAIEQEQFDKVQSMIFNANQTAETITNILSDSGLPTDADAGIGGPFVSPVDHEGFETSLDELGSALDRLDSAKSLARKMPVANPVPNRPVSSRYGRRRDPFLNRIAHHSGIDFKTAYGEPVLATGSGTVTTAGRKGGYGKMIEIDHGNGITTRFAHLSRIYVSVGTPVASGFTIGAAGSTGRSTGPHLHYEVRLNDRAVNPQRFLSAGRKLQPLL